MTGLLSLQQRCQLLPPSWTPCPPGSTNSLSRLPQSPKNLSKPSNRLFPSSSGISAHTAAVMRFQFRGLGRTSLFSSSYPSFQTPSASRQLPLSPFLSTFSPQNLSEKANAIASHSSASPNPATLDASSTSLPILAAAVESSQLSLGELLRPQFPILFQDVNGGPLVYLDSAATSQKPLAVLDAMHHYNTLDNANVHRGVHTLSARATDAYEGAREKVAKFVNAESSREIVFTRNASEAINLVAYAWGGLNLKPGDEVVLSVVEHHSNIVTWQLIAQRTGAILKFADLTADESQVDEAALLSLISKNTKLVAIHHVSNTLGSQVQLERVVEKAHAEGALVLLDACQSVPHLPIDVRALSVDFLAASGHKMCGPTGIGFLYAPMPILEAMPPFMGGGEMIADVFLEKSTYASPPSRFEAGTPAIAEAIGLGAAVDFLSTIGMDRIHAYEMELCGYLYERLSGLNGVRIYGPPPPTEKGGHGRGAALCAFNVEGLHPTDLSTFLDQEHGIAIRSGHHCTQPLHRRLGINASARASLHIYNTKADVDTFIDGIKDTIDFFSSFK